jgi:hypothetical protein
LGLRGALQLYRELWPVALVFIWGFFVGGAFFIMGFVAELGDKAPTEAQRGPFGIFNGWLAFSLGALSLLAFLILTALLNWVIGKLPITGERPYIGLPSIVGRLTPGSQIAGLFIVIAGFGLGLYLGSNNW